MRRRKYPQPLTRQQADSVDLSRLPKSGRPYRSVKGRTDGHGPRGQALAILSQPAAYNLFATVRVPQAPGSFPPAVYSALVTLLAVAVTQAGVLRLLADDPSLMRALLRGLAEHGDELDAVVVARKGLPSKASWNRFYDLVEDALDGDPEAVREQFRLNAVALAMLMGHLDPASARDRVSKPDIRTFVTIDGTVLKSPTDNTDEVVLDPATGEARVKRTDPSRSLHHEGGQADQGSGVTVHGTKFVTLHSHGPAWRDTITLDLAHDSEPRPGRGPAEPGSRSEVDLALSMVYRLVERDSVTPWGEALTTPEGAVLRPFVAGVVYDKALRGVHAQALAQRDLIAVSEIMPARAARDGRPAIYRDTEVKQVACTNIATSPAGLPTHQHILVASRGRVWERVLLVDGTSELKALPQRVERRPRVKSPTVWYRRVTIPCDLGEDDHEALISILEPAAPAAEPNLAHMPTPPAPARHRRRASEDELSRGEYLRIFAEGEDAYNAVRPQRPLAESRNSELDAALPGQRIPAYGVFRQTLWMLGFYNGGNLINHHYATTHAVPGRCADTLTAHESPVVIVERADTTPPQDRVVAGDRTRCTRRTASSRPSPRRPQPARPPGGRPANRR